MTQSLVPLPTALPYHRAICDHFRSAEPEVFAFYADASRSEGIRETVRLSLLKAAVRLDPDTRPELYQAADEVGAALGLEAVPVTLYQAQGGEQMNAGLYMVPGEIHVLLMGPVLERLGEGEIRALLGHEFGHYLLFCADAGAYHSSYRILEAQTAGHHCEFATEITAQRFDLYTELFCDRAALRACGDLDTAVATLVKVATGLSEVSASSYLRQAEEIFAQGPVQSEGEGHPEHFVRARALQLYAVHGAAADDQLVPMIEGARSLDALDLPGQVEVTGLTRALIDHLLADPQLVSAAHLAQSHLYFDSYARPEEVTLEFVEDLEKGDDALRDYYCYVVIDFAAVDREQCEGMLGRGLSLFAPLSWSDRLLELAGKELGLRKRELESLRRQLAAPSAEPPSEDQA